MEVPVMCGLSDAAASSSCLNGSSFLSRVFPVSGVEVLVANASSFWACGALVLAIVAALSSAAVQVIRVSIFRPRSRNPLISQPLLRTLDDDDDDFSTSDEEGEEEDETTSSSAASSDDDEPSPSEEEDDFRVAGSSSARGKEQGHNRNFPFSWSDFANGKSVVKVWDSNSPVAGRSQIPAASPALIAAAAADEARKLAISVWDRRIGRRSPAIYAEWRPQQRAVARVDRRGNGKALVGNTFPGELTIGDLRKAGSPLGKITESDGGDACWDAGCCDSVVARCRDVVGFYLL